MPNGLCACESFETCVKRVADWPYSTFHQYVAQGIYLPCGVVIEIFRLAAANNMRPITLR